MLSALPAAGDGASHFVASRLEAVFDHSFGNAFNTRLQGGFDEPLYRPPDAEGHYGVIQYRADYFASALHEVAHWCIAGAERRTLLDYGYWYAPDGRSPAQQTAFENVEYKPQALEWYFAKACGYPFRVSEDNLDNSKTGGACERGFHRRILRQAFEWQWSGLPERARVFYRSLCREFERDPDNTSPGFSLSELE